MVLWTYNNVMLINTFKKEAFWRNSITQQSSILLVIRKLQFFMNITIYSRFLKNVKSYNSGYVNEGSYRLTT